MKCIKHVRVRKGNKEAKTWTARKIIIVDHYQFSVERSIKLWAQGVPAIAIGTLARKSDNGAVVFGVIQMVWEEGA